ncbi:formyltransferase family protein [Bradyrhizobium sp. AT1]|uniref:formyltransferase family protein n=1 Tax=Bradyrhizobium sp. AT1 TaxID=574934 RepID=UPI0018DCA09B|nr:formyltransferase family protein [Bradyrhizobium sp. AT1]
MADYYLIAGAGILSPAAIGRKKIVNAHPGIIPAARGLDAFKWSIFHGVPLGITLHFVDADVDSGDVIAIVETPVLPEDDIFTLARRHYELEIEMLVDFRALLQVGGADSKGYPERPARMRMPRALEKDMLERFETYKEEFSVASLSRWRQHRVDTARVG